MLVTEQGVQQLKRKVQEQEEQLSCAQRSGKDLQAQLLAQAQTGHAAQRDAAQLKVRLEIAYVLSLPPEQTRLRVTNHISKPQLVNTVDVGLLNIDSW